jgi:rod shape-determining protein MreD
MKLPKSIKIFLLISLVLFFQLGIFPHIAILGIFPNLILISVLCLAILKGFKSSLIWTVIAGLFLDFYSLNVVPGIFVISLFFVCFLAFFLSQSIFKKTNPLSTLSVFLITILIFNLLILLLYAIFGVNPQFNLLKLAIEVIYNSLVALPIFYLIKKIFPAIKIHA